MISLKTVLIGFGKIGAGYASDPAMAHWYPYAAHAQVLRDHPAFDWVGVVDTNPEALAVAQQHWGVPEVAASPAGLSSASQIEVAVIATPPDNRLVLLDAFPNLRAVLVEKPLGSSIEEGAAFLEACRRRDIVVAVNIFRRYDHDLAALANGGLVSRIGRPQAAFVTYGNGLLNNGTHMVDLIHMLLGRTVSVQAISPSAAFTEGPLQGDLNFHFALVLNNGLTVLGSPLRFSAYRENGLDIWGEDGRLQLVHEGLTEICSPVGENRALTGACEIVHDQSVIRTTSIGAALFNAYDNLVEALLSDAPPKCSGEEALYTSYVIDSLFRSQREGGRCFDLDLDRWGLL